MFTKYQYIICLFPNRNKLPKKVIRSIAEEHAEMFMPHTAECQYDLEYVCEGSPTETSTIYLPMLFKNYNLIRLFAVNGYKFSKISKLTGITYNFFTNLSPLLYKN